MADSSGRQHIAEPMRWSGRILALVMTAFGGTMLIGSAVSEGVGPLSVDAGLPVLIGLVAPAGTILSWLRDLPAGVVLVIISAGLGAHIAAFAGRNHFEAWSIVGLPYLIAGLLLLCAWRVTWRRC